MREHIDCTRSLDAFTAEAMEEDPPTMEEELRLVFRIAKGDKEARDELITRNLRLCFHLAKQRVGNGVSLDDIIMDAALGLTEAMEKWDPKRGMKFSSFAVWGMKNEMRQQIARLGKPVNLPLSNYSHADAKRSIRRLKLKNGGHAPTEKEFGEDSGLPPGFMHAAMVLDSNTVCLDEPDPITEKPRVNMLPGNLESPDSEAERNSDREYINRMAEGISERNWEITKKAFGIDGPQMTLEDISKIYDMSRENVRQIRNRTLEKMRKQAARIERESVPWQ